jgi:hypothetical protein
MDLLNFYLQIRFEVVLCLGQLFLVLLLLSEVALEPLYEDILGILEPIDLLLQIPDLFEQIFSLRFPVFDLTHSIICYIFPSCFLFALAIGLTDLVFNWLGSLRARDRGQ